MLILVGLMFSWVLNSRCSPGGALPIMAYTRRHGLKGVPLSGLRYCWFSHDVTKIQTTKLSILPRFYFHDALEQLKSNFHTNFHFKRVLGFVIEYAWISKLLRDAAFTWRPRELSCRLKKWLIQEILLSRQFMYKKKYHFYVYEFLEE